MIKIVKGDLLQATEDIIGHQCNCLGVMGSGVAEQVREQFPVAYTEYKKLCENNRPESLLGTCQFVESSNGKIIANLFGQLKYGRDKRHTDLVALRKALKELLATAKLGLSVALPFKLGSDRGGADWKEVYKIIDEVFADYEVTLYNRKK